MQNEGSARPRIDSLRQTDHASVQINIGHLDENGIYTGRFSALALSGFVRAQGDGESALDRLRQKKNAEARLL